MCYYPKHMSKGFDWRTIGLEIRDRRVYEALVACPQSSLRKIAAGTGINRGSVYESIKSLTECGLVGTIDVGKQTRYSAADPSAIVELLKEKRSDLEAAERRANRYIETLAEQDNTTTQAPFATFYSDREGIAAILRDVIATCRGGGKNSTYRVISTKRVRELIYDNFRNFTQRRIAENISVRVIAVGTGGKQDGLSERRWLSATRGDAPNCYTLIYGKKSAFISANESGILSAIVIDNAGVTQLQKELFDHLWQTLE